MLALIAAASGFDSTLGVSIFYLTPALAMMVECLEREDSRLLLYDTNGLAAITASISIMFFVRWEFLLAVIFSPDEIPMALRLSYGAYESFVMLS